jgi:hypothetical protein
MTAVLRDQDGGLLNKCNEKGLVKYKLEEAIIELEKAQKSKDRSLEKVSRDPADLYAKLKLLKDTKHHYQCNAVVDTLINSYSQLDFDFEIYILEKKIVKGDEFEKLNTDLIDFFNSFPSVQYILKSTVKDHFAEVDQGTGKYLAAEECQVDEEDLGTGKYLAAEECQVFGEAEDQVAGVKKDHASEEQVNVSRLDDVQLDEESITYLMVNCGLNRIEAIETLV